jgi:phosphate transport system ATP-binding protein
MSNSTKTDNEEAEQVSTKATEPTTPATPQTAAQSAAAGTQASSGPAVETKGLRAYYGTVAAVNGVDISFAANKVTAIIGPSGCGKSTLVRCINRMHEEIPAARATGEVTVDGLDIYAPGVDLTAVRRLIGMVFQKATPFPTMSVSQNVAAGLKLTGTKAGDVKERVERALQAVGLWDEVKDRLNSPGIGLSGGQQQRLCIARTIAVEPEVILMDEPCSALDPQATLRVEELIEELKSQYTIIIVTHNMQQASRASDSTVFMLDGLVVEQAPTKQLFTNPRDERTERYVTGKFG